jgi:hypothetical protein
MSFVIRHVFPRAGAHADGKSTAQSHIWKRIGRQLRGPLRSCLRIVVLEKRQEHSLHPGSLLPRPSSSYHLAILEWIEW